MTFNVQITHRLNKLIRSLHQKKYRDENELFIAEGETICRELLDSKFVPELLVIRDYPSAESLRIAELYSEKGIPVYTSPKNQFDQLSDTKSPQGIISIVNMMEIEPDYGSSFVALDSVADPGNVGTIIRTADWFGIRQVVLGGESADKFNPKVVRSTMGSLFRTSVVYTENLADMIREHYKNFEIFGAALDSKKSLKSVEHKDKFGIIFGNEAGGISNETMKVVSKKFRIEGAGACESLNVAISVGVSLYHFMHGNSALKKVK